MENQDLSTQAGPEAASTADQGPQLTIADLQNLRGIIDVAVRRGAFGAQEASSVGAVFDRLNSFLNAVAPAPTADQTAADSAPADSTAQATDTAEAPAA
jgi:glutamine amidotransferase PdxT